MLRGYSDSGFFAEGAPPHPADPENWYVWHFTHIENIGSIVAAGGLVSDNSDRCVTDVASAGIKETRRSRRVEPTGGPYPPGLVVADHVPFYFASRSPMLYCVTNGYQVDYQGGDDPLVFLGVRLGDLWGSGLTWCATDRNAATSFARFTIVKDGLGEFIDFSLMRERIWKSTPEDGDRQARRAAEILVARSLPLGVVSVVATRSVARMQEVQAMMGGVSGVRQYEVMPQLYYPRRRGS